MNNDTIQNPNQTLLDLLQRRANAANATRAAYTFLDGGATPIQSLTWADLHRRAQALTKPLRIAGAANQPVLLALPSGLAFVESLFACWYAGAIAVPVSLPRHQRTKHRLDRIIANAGARFAIGTTQTRQLLESAAETNLQWIDPAADTAPNPPPTTHHPQLQDIAVLQFTSGSTGDPRGVIVTHQNLMRNSAIIAQACGHSATDTIAGWLPLFHDMGLIGLITQAAYTGCHCVFMSPERFLMRPWLWLQMISDYRAVSSPAPNFAYELCVDRVDAEQKSKLDLSCWRNALNGSEPVRPATLDRFAAAFASSGFKPEAFFPCYGLAESTLFVTGPGESRQVIRRAADGKLLPNTAASAHLACGQTYGDTQIQIVDPQTAAPAPPGKIGEIWITGQSVAAGYWNNKEATVATFNARLSDDSRSWLRSGDLGFLADGQLFITGRLRELIIIAGRNIFPVDLERTVESSDSNIAPSSVAAFAIEHNSAERVVIAAEVRREQRKRQGGSEAIDVPATIRHIRGAIALEHEIAVHEILLLPSGALPRTTSGKISRQQTRSAYLSGSLPALQSAYAAAS